MRTLGFVPCREHSARFPGKNLTPFMGKPLVQWTLELAEEGLRLGLFDRVILDYEGWEPRDLARQCAPQVEIYKRESVMRASATRVIDLIRWHLIFRQTPDPVDVEAVCVLWPTSPLRTMRHLVESFRLLDGADVVLSVVPVKGGYAKPVLPETSDVGGWNERMGALRHDGTALWARRSFLVSDDARSPRGFYATTRIADYPVPPEESADVDVPLDLEWARFLFERRLRCASA